MIRFEYVNFGNTSFHHDGCRRSGLRSFLIHFYKRFVENQANEKSLCSIHSGKIVTVYPPSL